MVGRHPHRLRHASQQTPRWAMALLIVTLLGMLLAGCGNDPNQAVAHRDKAQLDSELRHARNTLGLPDSMLQPIITQENQIAAGEGGFNYNYQDAATNYTLLYNQLIGIEENAQQTLQKQASDDIQAFASAVNHLRSEGFSEIEYYQARLYQALQDYNTATKPGDFATIDATARQQTAALNALWPAYQKLQQFATVLRTLQSVGTNSVMGQAEYQQNLDAIRSGLPADEYPKLVAVIDGQILQAMADQAEATPYVGATLLDSFQASINLLKSYGQDTKVYQQQHDHDVTLLKAAKTTVDYLKVGQTINAQQDTLAAPLLKAKATSDYAQLKSLLAHAETIKLTTTRWGPGYVTTYPVAYEYSDPYVGIQDAKDRLDNARDLSAYQSADEEIIALTDNLRALLDNLPYTVNYQTVNQYAAQPHPADLELINTAYHLTGKVIVVSLREQVLRAYDNGQLVWWTYVTTGSYYDPKTQLPSWPGLHYAMYKEYHTEFISPEPKGSRFWYAPTPINYAIAYAPGGYFLHDAWWRPIFGPETNLPHWDPTAFSGGSHGCINLPENNMLWLYNWTDIGTPIIVY